MVEGELDSDFGTMNGALLRIAHAPGSHASDIGRTAAPRLKKHPLVVGRVTWDRHLDFTATGAIAVNGFSPLLGDACGIRVRTIKITEPCVKTAA